MLRHSAFFMFREDTTLEQAVQMLKGLAYMRFACPSVRALDFGLDEFGGSSLLREVKPWKRQPRWRSARTRTRGELRRRSAPGLRRPGRHG